MLLRVTDPLQPPIAMKSSLSPSILNIVNSTPSKISQAEDKHGILVKSSVQCKCCFGLAEHRGTLDFNKTCHDRIAGRVFPYSEILINYYVCKTCGFIFTPDMNDWSHQEFRQNIYNSEYCKADGALPGYESAGRRETISYRNGLRLASILDGAQDDINVLDYGAGGNPGDTGLALIEKGFRLQSYDPYFGNADELPDGQFDFIYLIEVIEHCADVNSLAQTIAGLLSCRGIVHIQTMLHPNRGPKNILDSWYIAPRNGHISIFTFEALSILFRKYGINITNHLYGIFGFKSNFNFPNKIFV